MKANLPQREPERLARWAEQQLYEQLQQRPATATYVLHDGPPYANGDIHIGHALNKTLKDIIIRFQTMRGAKAPYVPGWDCHGMPIEHQVLKELGRTKHEVDRVAFRRQAHDFAARFVQIQREQFKRLGILGDWERPYLTMDRAYEASIVRVFRELFLAGYVYRALKPVYWCWSCETALAEAEVEYRDKQSPSVYVKFPLVDQPHSSIVIWTTTPWTLPANRAVCVHPDHLYALMNVSGDTRREQLLMAKALVPQVLPSLGIQQSETIWEKPGRALTAFTCQPPFSDSTVPVVTDESVSLDEGTGIVHLAPGHGEVDYVIGAREGLEVASPVDPQGRFTDEVHAYRGQRVFEANDRIVRDLTQRHLVLHHAAVQHAYPHCWRCEQPVIFRATAQWFVRMDQQDLRQRVLKAIERVQWYPRGAVARIRSMMETRPDWCLSRQRYWGVPIPIVYCGRCQEPLRDPRVFDHLESLVRQEGSDVWFARDVADLLPAGVQCPCGEATQFTKEEDILDVWLDSGVSHEAVLRHRAELTWPADLYLEGSDQHRGWFQSSIISSVALHDQPPYRAVLTHGFVVDGAGRKMSKSAGNVMAPSEILTQYGADILRWWVASCDYTEDVRLSPEILARTAESYRKVRNTLRFLLGNLADFDPRTHRVSPEGFSDIDRWIWWRCQQVLAETTAGYTAFTFARVVRVISAFCVIDLSSIYLDALKDCLYTALPNAPKRRAAQTVLYDILEILIRITAPILVFTADEAWEHLAVREEDASAAHMLPWPVAQPIADEQVLATRWEELLAMRGEILKALETARASGQIGSALEAVIRVEVPAADVSRLTPAAETLTMLSIVSGLTIAPGTRGRTIHVQRADGRKCGRCWMFRATVGQHAEHAALCDRCVQAICTE